MKQGEKPQNTNGVNFAESLTTFLNTENPIKTLLRTYSTDVVVNQLIYKPF